MLLFGCSDPKQHQRAENEDEHRFVLRREKNVNRQDRGKDDQQTVETVLRRGEKRQQDRTDEKEPTEKMDRRGTDEKVMDEIIIQQGEKQREELKSMQQLLTRFAVKVQKVNDERGRGGEERAEEQRALHRAETGQTRKDRDDQQTDGVSQTTTIVEKRSKQKNR